MSQHSCLPLPSRKERKAILQKDGVTAISGKLQIANLEGMDAMEYLAKVSAEAEALPDVVRRVLATNDVDEDNSDVESPSPINRDEDVIDGTCASLKHLLSRRTDLAPCPAPTSRAMPRRNVEEWTDKTLDEFSSLRYYLQRCAHAGVGRDRAIRDLPTMKDRAGWHEYCLGRDESRGNVGSYFQDDDDEEEEEDIEEMEEQEQEETDENNNAASSSSAVSFVVDGRPPTVQLLLQMDQVMARTVLSHHVYFLEEGWEATETRTAWIYALLARLERPLHRDDLAVLRRLLRECCRRRWEIAQQETEDDDAGRRYDGRGVCVAGLNAVVCVVGLYFEQGRRSEIMIGGGE